MNVPETVNFDVSNYSKSNIISRYYVILSHMSRVYIIFVLTPIVSFGIYELLVNPKAYENMSQGTLRQNVVHALYPYAIGILAILIPGLIFCGFAEWMYTEKMFKRRLTHATEKELISVLGYTSRSIYRYCAAFEMSGDKIVVTDKVRDLIGGDLILTSGCRNLKDDLVRFEFNISQITAMWISRDLIVLRFCWGMDAGCEWDVIIDRSRFENSNDHEFVRYMTKELIFKRITYDMERYVNSSGRLHFGNEQTNVYRNPIFPWVRQRRVKIYHNLWGPFKKKDKNGSKNQELGEGEEK